MAKETVGKISSDLLQKTPESTDPIEIERAMQENYLDELKACVEKHLTIFSDNFFIVVITKNERLMPNVFRNYFFARQTCPTPDYDQTVFLYNRPLDQIEYIWTIPSQEASHHLKENALQVHPSERGLLDFVLQFADGSLYKLAKKLNGEEITSSLLIES